MVAYWTITSALLFLAVSQLLRKTAYSARERYSITGAILALLALAYLLAPMWQLYLLASASIALAFSTLLRDVSAKIVRIASLCLLLICTLLGYLFPLYEPESPGGPHHVGYVDHYHDMTGMDTYASTDLERRLIPVKIWFPTNKPAEQKVGFDGLLVGLKARYSYLPVPDWVLNNLQKSSTSATFSHSVLDMKLPTVVYNHGGGSYPEDNRVLMEKLASNGYIMISIGHPLSSSAIQYPDGSLIYADFDAYGRTNLSEEQRQSLNDQWNSAFIADSYQDYLHSIGSYILAPDPSTNQVRDWMAETLIVISDMRSLPVIGASIDPDRIAFAGYSLGGATAIEICRSEDICRALVNLDGLPVGSSGIMETDLGKPLLVISSNKTSESIDRFTPNQFLAAQNSADSYNVLIPEATHSQFSSDGYYSPLFNIGYGDTTYHRTQELVTNLTLGFLDKHLAGKETQALPKPSSTVSIIHH